MNDTPEPENDSPETNAMNQTIHANEVTNKVDEKQIAQFVTTIRNAEEQVGQHIIRALQHTDTVAVITTVAMGPDGKQRVISAALSPERLKLVQEILQDAEDEREDEEPCVGFHCLVKPKVS
ncbi:hypothetical protein Poly51_12300 [Rubripirellula tenax]|uniref:Uncharacterized protein n=1 Tax=Rubripirellula tenax TaxID=2528015 RepID=A0A5C6FCK5_9BACT|nr:hypothetical protein [Rubripirellula tenax]TWU58452.1 hypothetical protein Poly51_12300 [Rubripirellula tenax]